MTAPLPTVVLVHGSWHTPAHYAEYADQLRVAGFDVVVPHLPSCNTSQQPGANMYDDAEKVRTQVVELVDSGKDVIMVLHSYGGAVGTEAVKGLAKAERQKNGQPGGVVHLVYMCAFILQVGQSLNDACHPRPDPDPVAFDASTGTAFPCHPPKQLLYADVDDETVRRMESLLVPQSVLAMGNPITYAAWKDIPSTYLMTLQDEAVPLSWQNRQLQAVQDSGSTIAIRKYDCSHSPFLSRIGEMVEVVREVA